jgi:hypothetical protein
MPALWKAPEITFLNLAYVQLPLFPTAVYIGQDGPG